MADLKVESQESSFDENLDARLEKIRDAKEARVEGRREAAEAKAPEAEPTQPVADPQPAPSWKDTPIGEDVDHGFFRGKKVGDLYQSYRHVETAKQQAERERNELRQQVEQLRREREAEAAARKVLSEQQEPRQVEPGEDPRYRQVDELWFTDNVRARKILAEINREEAAKIASQEIQKYRQETEAETNRRQVLERGGRAYDEAAKQLNLDAKVWNLRAPAVMLQLTDPNSPYYGDGYNVFRPEAYIQVYRDIYGEPTQPAPQIVVKPAPELPTPPGSKKPTPVTPADTTPSPVSAERRAVLERIASIGKIDPDFLAERHSRRMNRG